MTEGKKIRLTFREKQIFDLLPATISEISKCLQIELSTAAWYMGMLKKKRAVFRSAIESPYRGGFLWHASASTNRITVSLK